MEEARRLGIIDTLNEGFSTLNKRIWLIGIPVLLDIALWLGPKISFSPPTAYMLDWYHRLLTSSSSQLSSQYSLSAEQIDQAYAQMEATVELLNSINILGLLTWQLPSMVKLSMVSATPAIHIDSLLKFSVTVIVLLCGGILITSAYLGSISQFVRTNRFNTAFYWSRIWINWARYLSFFAILLIATLSLLPLFLMIVGLVSMLIPALGSLLLGVWVAGTIWLLFYLFFVDEAIFVGDVNALQAIWHSLNVVHRNFWSSLGLFLVVNLILLGTLIIWGLLMGNPLGLVIAVLCNAYIATGLAAATMIYYRQRYQLWHELKVVPN